MYAAKHLQGGEEEEEGVTRTPERVPLASPQHPCSPRANKISPPSQNLELFCPTQTTSKNGSAKNSKQLRQEAQVEEEEGKD